MTLPEYKLKPDDELLISPEKTDTQLVVIVAHNVRVIHTSVGVAANRALIQCIKK